MSTKTRSSAKHSARSDGAGAWPPLPLSAWKDTHDTLHMWTQIVGKVKLELCPFLNEWWEVALHLSARGITTATIPWQDGVFEVEFDFIDHNLRIRTSHGALKSLPLMPRSVAEFYGEFMAALRALGIDVAINTLPQEVEQPIPFENDTTHAAYDPEYANRWWRVLTRVQTVFEQYRSGFCGKSSPAHFFWGSFDLSQTRFCGKPALPPQGANRIMRFSEDQENIAAGFWPGSKTVNGPAFYSYTYPEPPGYKTASVRPSAARYDSDAGLFLLLYDDVRTAASPERTILEFLQSTYEVGANLSGWDRVALEQRGPNVGRTVAPAHR
jgi:hypothetical protein